MIILYLYFTIPYYPKQLNLICLSLFKNNNNTPENNNNFLNKLKINDNIKKYLL